MKDPAALLYIDVWYKATTEMSAEARAYYMDLILHQFDKKSLPNDIEELANICRVRISEFPKFKQVFEQVLKQKFKLTPEGRLVNPFASEIIRKREAYKEKRTVSGRIGYIVKFAKRELQLKKKEIEQLKRNLDTEELMNLDLKDEQNLSKWLSKCLSKNGSNANSILNGNGDIYTHNISITNSKEEIEYNNYQELLNVWNSFAEKHGLTKVNLLTKERKRHIKARLKEESFNLINILKAAELQEFLLGNNDRGWTIDFDWIVSSTTNYVKVLEGKYRSKNNGQRKGISREELYEIAKDIANDPDLAD